MAYNCRFLAQALEFSDKYEKQINTTFIESIGEAVLLHNIGRLSAKNANGVGHVPHEQCGVEFLKDLSFLSEHNEMLQMAIDVAKCHNERWDGTGRPAGIKGDDIPLSARILSVCKRFESECGAIMAGNNELSIDDAREKAVAIIADEAGTTYDPDLVKIFMQVSRQLSILK